MRRMRDLTWQYGLYAIPAVAAAFGLQYLIRTHHPDHSGSPTASVLKPSYFKPDSGVGSKSREIASVKETSNRVRTKEDLHPDSADVAENNEDADDAAAAQPAEPPKAEAKTEVKTQHLEVSRATASEAGGIREDTPISAITTGGNCSAVEYRGDGPHYTKITKAEWATVMQQFHQVKADLLTWLERHHRGFPDKTVELMQAQVEKLKIQRPPAMEEPDLTWRGIGVWTQNGSDEPIVRMGSGFVKLAIKAPARAKFELARLVAQSWAPCELKRVSAGEAWEPLLACLGVNEQGACGAGTFSEGGWAVSTTIAAIVAPPGCTVPAFADTKVAQCLKKVPLPLKIADSDIANRTEWKEASR